MPEEVALPAEPAAEELILSKMLRFNECIEDVASRLKPQHFVSREHRMLYQHMVELHAQGQPVVAEGLLYLLRRVGEDAVKAWPPTRLAALHDMSATWADVDHLCSVVLKSDLSRELYSLGASVQAAAFAGDPNLTLEALPARVAALNGNLQKGEMTRGVESLESILSREIEAPKSIVGDGLFNAGQFVLFTGASGIGKSYALMQLCAAVASGTEWFGFKTLRSNVLLVSLEMDDYYIKQRFMAINPTSTANITVLCRPQWKGELNLQNEAMVKELCSVIRANNIEILVIDPLNRVHRSDENDTRSMGDVLAAIDYIRIYTGVNVCLSHHEGKKLPKNVKDMDAARGSGRLQNDPHVMVRLLDTDGGLEMRFPKTNFGRQPDKIYLIRCEDGTLAVQDRRDEPETLKQKGSKTLEAIKDALMNAGGVGMSGTALAEAAGLTRRASVYPHLRTLQCEKNAHGKFILPEFAVSPGEDMFGG